MLLAIFGASFVAPIFYTASLEEHRFLMKTHYCEVIWPQDYRYHYTVITTAAHYFLTLIIVCVLYTKIYLRLRLRYVNEYRGFENLSRIAAIKSVVIGFSRHGVHLKAD